MPCADDYVEDTGQAVAAEVRVGIVCGVAKPLAIAAGDSDHIENVNVKVAVNVARAEETSLRSLHE
jgi:hypothetical protein